MSRLVVTALLALTLAGSAGAQAPSGKCALVLEFDRINTFQLPSGQRNTFLGGNVTARCPSQKMVLKSDSLEVYGDEGRSFFIGHVDYREPRLSLKSDFLTYFQKEERLLAFLNVDARLPTGTTMKGTSLEYWRPIARTRPKQRAIALGRPTMSIVEKDAQGKAQPPITVTGNTIWLDGDSVVASSGEVVVVRPELTATGDSLYLDGGSGLLRIMRNPRIVGTKGRKFTLVGQTVDLLSRRRKLERVLAKTGAEAVSEDLTLKSDTIDLRVTDDLLQRALAWGTGRAHATSPAQTIVADSIDVSMPGQRMRTMHAVRAASAQGTPDTTKFRTTEKDRLTGDTIVATFDSVAVRDTAGKPQIRQLVAIGQATSYQLLPAQDTSLRIPAINYLKGDRITVSFDSARVKKVDVVGKVAGVLAEPDSTQRPIPTGSTPPAGTPPRVPPASTPAAPAPVMPRPPAATPAGRP